MLYRTTRGKHDVVTAYKTVHADCYVDGGLFLPFRMPLLNKSRIQAMAASSPSQIMADVLNELFSCGLTAWDVELAIGRRPVHLATIGRQIIAGELWNGERQDARRIVQQLSERIGGSREATTNWMEIGVSIALLFAAYGMLHSAGIVKGEENMDVAAPAGDFTLPMAAWYARQMGLPVGHIICGCNANGGLWELLNRGEFATGARAVSTCTPEASIIVPRNLERLIHGVFGVEENRRYLLCCSKGGTYTLTEEQRSALGSEMFAAVISDSRVGAIIPGVYRTRGYILSPYAALAYGSIQDFRATTGEERPTLLVAQRSPMKDGAFVGRLLKLKDTELQKRLTR